MTPLRILVLNNYDLSVTETEVRVGQKPGHHMYGVDRLYNLGSEVVYAPWDKSAKRPVSSWFRRLGLPLGDRNQQVWVRQYARAGDLVYAPCQTQTNGLALSRRLGRFHLPMLVLHHHPWARGRLQALRKPIVDQALRGIDRNLCLSRRLAEELQTQYHLKSKPIPMVWGPDLSFYPPWTEPGEGCISAGRTGRDHQTLVAAARRAGVKAKIIGFRQEVEALSSTGNVEVIGVDKESDFPVSALVREYSVAGVVAIPLHAANSLLGLTSVTDAMAMGRPMIVTRNPYLDLDVESLGVGVFVEPYDVDGWERALKHYAANPSLIRDQGRRARSIAEDWFNADTYWNSLRKAIQELPDV